ncbi:MAG: hypothetical protein GY714_32250 [Desulfobacterales bacterium]|nr:hypothetical protein [Desulfobacterales bacterium]
MEIKLTEPFLGGGIGDTISVSDERAKALVKNGKGKPVKAQKETATRKKKETADKK